jgi:hypothetical protein
LWWWGEALDRIVKKRIVKKFENLKKLALPLPLFKVYCRNPAVFV